MSGGATTREPWLWLWLATGNGRVSGIYRRESTVRSVPGWGGDLPQAAARSAWGRRADLFQSFVVSLS
jgi:hypothetical protein